MLYCFDKDGTIVFAPEGRMPRKPEEQTLLPNVAEMCQSLVDQGDVLAVASNQGGVAMGYLTLAEADALVRHAATMIGAAFYEFCPYHPDGIVSEFRSDAWCRKPKPGMIETLQRRTGAPWREIVFVGNSTEDYGAALSAGVRFVWASDFF